MPKPTKAPTRQQLLALLALLQQDQSTWQLGNILGARHPAPTITKLRRVLGDASITSPLCQSTGTPPRAHYHLVDRAGAVAWVALARPRDRAWAQARLDAAYTGDAGTAPLSDAGIRLALMRALGQ